MAGPKPTRAGARIQADGAAGHRHNLPAQLTSFVGRGREAGAIKRLLATGRLVTLTGAPGVGKTRLALRVAADLLEGFPNGVWLVELAPLADPTLVPQAVAVTLGLTDDARCPAIDRLIEFLRPRTLLLVLDNCEHLVGPCAELAEQLLRACPRLRVLATSRETLEIGGEIN